MKLRDIAKKYRDAGFSPIPLRRDSKVPLLKGWQKHGEIPLDDFSVFDTTNGIGLAMGYEGVQTLDIDAKYFEGGEYEEFSALLDARDPSIKPKMLIQRTPSGGFHWVFKCSEIAGNEKLSKNSKGEVIFETRGTGGQIVVAPTRGYRFLGKVGEVQIITPEERAVLFGCARALDKYGTKTRDVRPSVAMDAPSVENDTDTPWGDFRSRFSVLDVLQSAGWSVVKENDKMVYVLRPGQTDAETSGVIFKDSGLFFPFTTSTAFDSETPYDAFQAFVVLRSGGDVKAAIKELRADGFGKQNQGGGAEFLSDDALFESVVEGWDEDGVEEDGVEVSGRDKLMDLLMSMRVDSTVVVDKPENALTIHQGTDSYVFGTMGNFSLIQGKAKSRKSWFLSAVMGAAIGENDVCGVLRGHCSDKLNIYVDTEQGEWHVSQGKRRVHEMAGLDPRENAENFEHFRLRDSMSNKERLALVELIFAEFDNLGLVVIDGIVDLATKGVNDEEEAMELASRLLRWSSRANCHISVVLHENKGDKNAKGHLGAYLVQKAETTVSLAKSETIPNASDITPEYTRNMEFPKMLMTIDNGDIVLEFDAPETTIERVFSNDDCARIAPMLEGKTSSAAVSYIRDTEDVSKRAAERLLNDMEMNKYFFFEQRGRSRVVSLDFM